MKLLVFHFVLQFLGIAWIYIYLLPHEAMGKY